MKLPKRCFVRTIENKIQGKFEKIWLRFVGVAFLNFCSHRSHINENYKNEFVNNWKMCFLFQTLEK